MKKLVIVCALAAPMLSMADEVGHWYVTPNAGGISVDNRRALEDKDWIYGLGIGRHLSKWFSLEGNFNGAKLDGRAGAPDLSLYAGSLDLLGVANRGGVVSPYLSVGAGGARNDLGGINDSTDFMLQAGGGLFLRLWESADGARSFSLRPDLKVRWNDAGGAGHLRDYVGTLGFQYAFGEPEERVVAPVPAPVPAPAPVAEPVAPPPPADTDGDGVTDDRDQCPGTPAGVAVDAVGCPRKGSIALEGVTFELDAAVLTAEARSVLDGIGQDLRKYPRLRIELQGHTDSSGSDAHNQRLSQQRADSVRARLIETGVPAGRLEARGYGESEPIDSNTTVEGRARNRRVVMTVLDNPGDVQVKGEGKLD